MPTEELRSYGVFLMFTTLLRFGVAGAPVSDFGIKNRIAKKKNARNKGVSGNKIRRYRLV